MSENTRFIVLKVIRCFVAIVIIGYVVRLLPEIYRLLPEPESRVVKLIFLTLGLIVVCILLVGQDIFHVASRPVAMLIESFYFPRYRDAVPPANYKLPEYYLEKERFDEAINEYLIIIRYHPHEAKAYIGAFELAITEFNDDEMAKKIYAKGRKKLKKYPEDLMWLEARWARLANEWIISM